MNVELRWSSYNILHYTAKTGDLGSWIAAANCILGKIWIYKEILLQQRHISGRFIHFLFRTTKCNPCMRITSKIKQKLKKTRFSTKGNPVFSILRLLGTMSNAILLQTEKVGSQS